MRSSDNKRHRESGSAQAAGQGRRREAGGAKRELAKAEHLQRRGEKTPPGKGRNRKYDAEA